MRSVGTLWLLALLAGCSGSGANSGDQDVVDGAETAAPEDAAADDGSFHPGGDARPDWGEVEFIDASIPDMPYVAQCGNGVLDPDEECDDGNRLNGDGCDWLCRNGAGETPPEPDPTVDDYVPTSGDPGVLDHVGYFGTMRFTLVWTGTVFATAMSEEVRSGGPYQIRFTRFNEDGARLDLDWVYPGPDIYTDVELVWTGSGFGLFYNDAGWGIVFMELDSDGKPLGAPILVEADPRVLAFAADWTGDAFVLAWTSQGHGSAHLCAEGAPNPVRAALVGRHGSTEGFPGPVVVEPNGTWNVDVAAGDGAFGLAVDVFRGEDADYPCGTRFLRVSDDLTAMTYSGILSGGLGSYDVRWSDGGWATAWPNGASETPMGEWFDEVCVGRFSPDGSLAAAPVCTTLSLMGLGPVRIPRLAAGDGGLALVFEAGDYDRLVLLRTDLFGVPVGTPHDVYVPDPGTPFNFGHFTAAWAGDRFGVLFQSTRWPLALRTFVPE